MNDEKPKEVACPKCGRTFVCSHNTSCWCSKYVLESKTSEYIKKHYTGCLCEACIKEIIKSENFNL